MASPGGYQRPRNPAPVSGPGRLSRRTDGGVPQQTTTEMTGMGYGENADFNDIQSSAPLRATKPMSGQPSARQREARPAMQSVPLMSPTRRPEEPVTAGASFGPGETVSAMSQRVQTQLARKPSMVDSLSKVAAYDTSGRLQAVVNYLRSV